MLTVSLIFPVYNECKSFADDIQQLLDENVFDEIIVVTSASDVYIQSNQLYQNLSNISNAAFKLISVEGKGRALQMNAGGRAAGSDVLAFVHADTTFDAAAVHREMTRAVNDSFQWGRFDIRLIAEKPISNNILYACYAKMMFRLIGTMINRRSRLTGVATGDQLIFTTNAFFRELNGFAPVPLMEDVEFCKRAKKINPPYCSRIKVGTSARRWQKNGIVKTVWLMWKIRFFYWMGASPDKLAQMYRDAR